MKLVKTLFGPKTRGRTISFALVLLAYIIMTILQSGGSIPRMITSLLVPVCCYIVAAIGLNLNVGISGELNLGQAGFMALGGFSAAVVNACFVDGGVDSLAKGHGFFQCVFIENK